MTEVTEIIAEQSTEADLQRAKEEIAGPIPLLEPAAELMVDLVRGLPYNGTVHKRVEVRELNGNDEETLARYKKPEEVYDAVLWLGVERIGDLRLSDLPTAEKQVYLRQLLIGERDLLFLAVAKATYGDRRTFPWTCRACNREQDLVVTISEDFKPKEVEDCEQRVFRLTTSKGLEIEYRLATGADQMDVLGKESSLAEMNTILLSQCIISTNGQMVVDPMGFARGLPMRDRQALIKELIDRQPAIDTTVKFPCFGCQEEQQVAFGWLDFFRP